MRKLVSLLLALAVILALAGDSFARGGGARGGNRGGVRGGGSDRAGSARVQRRDRVKKDGKADQERVRCEDRESIRRRAARHRRNAD